MSEKKQTLNQALNNPSIRRALGSFVGCPEGGWGETDQAERRLNDALPYRFQRTYTMSELINAALEVNEATQRYQWREAVRQD